MDWAGRNDANTKVVFANEPLSYGSENGKEKVLAKPGDYVVVQVGYKHWQASCG